MHEHRRRTVHSANVSTARDSSELSVEARSKANDGKAPSAPFVRRGGDAFLPSGNGGRPRWNQIYNASRDDSAGVRGEAFDDLNVLLQRS